MELMYITLLVIWVPLMVAVIHLWTEVKGLKNSTHNIQYVPIDAKDQKFESFSKETVEKLTKDPFGNII